ncbi:hypothetical protein HY989_03070 [Candidatus Micrarchaeota archaeon]|nr:hypothetical protein [Candidatus Micrarchaeota archaeon]
MKSEFEIGFKTKEERDRALNVIKPAKNLNIELHVLQKGETSILYSIGAKTFSQLRARSTSLLRDLKIMLSVFEKASQKPKTAKVQKS